MVNLSITAAEFFGTPYGVAISNAFYSGNDPSAEKIIYLAITNEHETALREVHSIPGEDVPTMLARCCGDLCTFIGDIAATDTGRHAVEAANEKSLISQYKRVIIAVAVLAALLAAFAGVYFTMHDYTLKAWATNAWSAVFPGSKPIFTTDTTDAASPTDAETSAEVTTKRAAAAVGSVSLKKTSAMKNVSTTQKIAAATTQKTVAAAQTTKATSGSSSGASSATQAATQAAAPATAASASVESSSTEAPYNQEQEPASAEPDDPEIPDDPEGHASETPYPEEPANDSEGEYNEQSPDPDYDSDIGEQEE